MHDLVEKRKDGIRLEFSVYPGQCSRKPSVFFSTFAANSLGMILTFEHGAVRELRLNRPPVNALSPESSHAPTELRQRP